MRGFFEQPWSGGRTSVRRGLLGLFAVPIVLFCLVPVPLFAASLAGSWGADMSFGTLASGLSLLGYSFAALVGASLLCAVPAWTILRLLHRESGGSYALVGAAAGLGMAFVVLYSGSGPLRLDQALAFLFISFASGVGALAFWLIARESATHAESQGPHSPLAGHKDHT
jgi:hypothetical protein